MSYDRWRTLNIGKFTCAYCGAKPGSDLLAVEHMVPQCQHGSDHDNNLVCACRSCNSAKSGRIAVPESMLDGYVDPEGWVCWKRWGEWMLMYSLSEGSLYFERQGSCGYGFPIHDCIDDDWFEHFREKEWCNTDCFANLCDAMDFMRTLIDLPTNPMRK